MLNEKLSAADIAVTEQLIRPWIRRTPVMDIRGSDIGVPSERLTLKLELFQHAGSFKSRGAFANLLTRSVPGAGVAAASGGNHGVAVAYAARQLNKPATIFVPEIAAAAKTAKIQSYGAKLVIAGDRYANALAACDAWVAQSGALPIHAFNDAETLLGQATLGLELEEQAPTLESLLVAVGGGGLIGGIAAWYRGRTKLIAVEPESAPTLTYALAAGHPVDAPTGGIAADSLAPKRVGEVMFPFAQAFVDRIILVSDAEIRQAQQALWNELRILSEPGGAAALAALLSKKYEPPPSERIAVLVCGGNTDAISQAF